MEYIADDAFEGCENLTLLTPKDSYAHQWAAFSGQDYDVIEDADDSSEDCGVWGVDVTVETDEDGAERSISARMSPPRRASIPSRSSTEQPSK